MSSLVLYLTENKIVSYRTLPPSFEGVWKEGDKIKTEDGKEFCTIVEIVIDTKANRDILKKVIEIKKNEVAPPKIFFIQRDFKSTVKILKNSCSTDVGTTYLNSIRITKEHITVKNVFRCFTKINVNNENITCKIEKIKNYNELTLDYISKYMESKIDSVEIVFSVLEQGYTYTIENNKIIVEKNGERFTLKIIHPSYNDILIRLPKLVDEFRRRKELLQAL